MRDPCAVETVCGLAVLVLLHLRQGHAIHLGVATRGNERRHPTHRVRVVLVASLDKKLGVRAHERHGHRHLRTIGQHEIRPVPELLDDAEDVVPAARIQTARMRAQLVKDLLHLESGQDRLDQHRRPDRATRNFQRVLCEVEDVVPQAGFEVAFQLRQVEVGAAPFVEQPARVTEEVHAEVEQAA